MAEKPEKDENLTPQRIRLNALSLAVDRFKGCSITHHVQTHLDAAARFEAYITKGAANQKDKDDPAAKSGKPA